MKRQRPLKTGQRVKIGRKLVQVPGVASMTGPSAEVPAKPQDGQAGKPSEELPEALQRTVKAAYQ